MALVSITEAAKPMLLLSWAKASGTVVISAMLECLIWTLWRDIEERIMKNSSSIPDAGIAQCFSYVSVALEYAALL